MSITALTEEEAYQQLAERTTRVWAARGQVNLANGTTRPLPNVSNSEELLGLFSTMFEERKRQQGAAAFDTADTPVDETYRERRFQYVESFEGSRDRVYADSRGIKTVGIGFNMQRPDARDVWKRAGIQTPFDDVFNGQAALQPSEVRRLADVTIDEAERIVQSRLGDVSLTESQRLALVSMAFNGPSLIGPKLTAALRSGDADAAAQEILFNSGTRIEPKLARRRYMEAQDILGPLDGVRRLPDYAAYHNAVRGEPRAVS